MIHAFRGRTRVHQVLIGLAGALVLVLLVAEGWNTGFWPTAAATVVTGALCVAALCVPPGRFRLIAVCAVLASVALSLIDTQLLHRPVNTPGITELCALLLMIARTVRQQSPLSSTVLVPGTAAAAGLLFLRLPEADLPQVGAYVLPVALFGIVLMVMLGLYLRLADAYQARERRAAEQAARQAERLEHARELHDFVAHHVTAIVAQAKGARYVTSLGKAPKPAELDQVLAGIEEAGARAMESMRSMVCLLRTPSAPTAIRPAGDLSRVRELAEETVASGWPVALTLDPQLAVRTLPPELTTTVHRLVQESLTNIRKYADAAEHITVDIRLQADDSTRISVTITDDGRTTPPAHRPRTGTAADRRQPQHTSIPAEEAHTPQAGYALTGLAERVEALGGHFTAGPRPGTPGWEVHADLPLPPPPPTNHP
ncbi:sensor histidine kinase [Streptomyces sp. NPDC096198]|uniref:sensor histidine kinase n=1 Tax=Streptomyces sp. NPDC096198 TaxID=3366080 RepID=UPI0037FE6EFB